MKILSVSKFQFTESEQSKISLSAEKKGIKEQPIFAITPISDGGNKTLFDFFDGEGNYLFSFDRDGEQVFE